MVFANNYKNHCFHPLSFVFGVEESEDEPLHLEAQEEDLGVDSRQIKSGRRRRSAWGKRKHAATAEATAYRIVSYHRALPWDDENEKMLYMFSSIFFKTYPPNTHTFVCSAFFCDIFFAGHCRQVWGAP